MKITKIIRIIMGFEKYGASFLLTLITLLLFSQILTRYIFSFTIIWVEEICRLSFVWLVYFSVIVAANEGRHIRVRIVDLFLPPLALNIVNIIADFIWVILDFFIVYLGILLIKSTIVYEFKTPVTNIPMGFVYFVIPFCFAMIGFRVISFNIRQNIRNVKRRITTPEPPKIDF